MTNHNKVRKIIYIITLLTCYLIPLAQVPTNVNVNKLSDQQIKQIIQEVDNRGLSMDQAMQLAKTRGATQTQINQLQTRIREFQRTGIQTAVDTTGQSAITTEKKQLFEKKKPEFEPTEKNQKIFGFHLFNSENLTFEPSVNVPIPENYVLGIDDQITINIWGASQQTYQLTVSSNGSIQIPDLGPIYVAGIEFKQVEKKIRDRLVAIYRGMGEDHPNTFAEVSISNLRSIQVNVVGEVNAPGTYTLPATASAFNALYLSGGPNENGSFRNIKVLRENKEVGTIDVYDFLLHAKTNNNISLRTQDIVFIPTYDKRVAVSGAFKREGFYELTANETLKDLLDYTGGFADTAYQQRLTITRTTGKQLQIIDVAKDNYNKFVPQNGDSIVAGAIIDRYENRVTINGAIFRPGTYGLTDGMMLSDLINMADGVKESVYSNRGILIRLGKDLSPQTLAFNVQNVMNGTNDIELQREDEVIIQDIFSMRQERYIRIYGQVQAPGEYAYREHMSLKDLIFLAGGFTEAASESFIELARRHDYQAASHVSDQLATLHQFTVNRDLALDDKDARFELKPFDYIYVRKAPSYNEQRTVTIKGEIVYPGPYSIRSKTERISDLIQRSGGLTPQAYTKGAILKRKPIDEEIMKESLHTSMGDSLVAKAEEQMSDHTKLELRLDEILKNPGSMYDYILREDDQIIIPEVVQEIQISGEVLNPIGLAYQQNKPLKYYIDRSGGFSSNAKKGKVFIIYSDGTSKVTKGIFNRRFPKPEPGSQIIVPSKPEKTGGDQTSKWLAITSTFASLAVAIAAVVR